MTEFRHRSTTPSTVIGRQRAPGELWVHCPRCRALIYRQQLEDNYRVCPPCGYHFRLAPHDWIELLLDAGSFAEDEAGATQVAPSSRGGCMEGYDQKLTAAQARLGIGEALICGRGTIHGRPLAIAVSDFRFLGGSMGCSYGEKLAQAIEVAVNCSVPLLTVSSSGGVRIYEGILALLQMAKVSAVLTRLAESRQPHFAIMMDVCYGGVFASFVSSADVLLAEPGAQVGLAGPRVVEQTIREKPLPGCQTVESLLEHGMIDAIVPRMLLRSHLATLLRIYQA